MTFRARPRYEIVGYRRFPAFIMRNLFCAGEKTEARLILRYSQIDQTSPTILHRLSNSS